MCGADDQWVKSAMADDTVVVDLLLRLHGTAAVTPSPLPLEWSVRQRRSIAGNHKKQAQRASPTTPLSFSGATAISEFSGGAGGCEDSSSRRPVEKLPAAGRSKVNSEGEKTSSKRSRKKTLPELKDEQRSLLQEKRELYREIAVLRSDLEKQRILNENLKRMKIELRPSLDKETCALPTIPPSDVMSASITQPELFNPKFELPDLNIPLEVS